MFAAFALSPRFGGVFSQPPLLQREERPLAPPLPLPLPPPPLPRSPSPAQPDPERDAYAASVYEQLASSPLLVSSLDPRFPTVPVILHPSIPRGGAARPVTARHIGFLRVDLTGESAGPGRFFPLFPEDPSEQDSGVDTGSLDRFGCSGHWASSGCIRLLTASTRTAHSTGSDSDAPAGATESDAAGDSSGCEGRAGGLGLLPLHAFAALWERCMLGSSGGAGGSNSSGSSDAAGANNGSSRTSDEAADGPPSQQPCPSSSGSESVCWHVPYSRILPLEEAYGGLARELKAAGVDLSCSHYMLRGWKTREGRPRLGGSGGPRAPPASQRKRRGVVPAELAATRDLRAMMSWPGLLELLEEEGVASVPTDGVRYWLARLGGGFQARLAAAGVLCSDSTVHHIIARNSRGIDHPLNYFIVDRGPNSAMGSKVEGFRDANGIKLHMRDVVGERAFEVAHAACNLYHGVLYAGRRRGVALQESLKELREGAFALAEEAIEARRAQETRRQARAAAAGAAGEGTPGAAATAAAAEDGAQEQQRPGSQAQPQPRSLKRERCTGQEQGCVQEWGGGEDAPVVPAGVLSPSQRQQERRRRLSVDLQTAAGAAASGGAEPAAAAATAAAAAVATAAEAAGAAPAAAAAAEVEALGEEEAEAGLAALSLQCSPEGRNLQAGEVRQQQRQQREQQQRGEEEQKEHPGEEQGAAMLEEEAEQQQQQFHRVTKPAADFSSLRARLRAALGVT